MGKRRLFSQVITETDAFLDMPLTAQGLYFHLGMNADDDGFVSPRKIMRMIGANADDLRVLIAKRFLLEFDSGVVVIKHWLINNSIRQDRYHQTTYKKELTKLTTNEFGSYTEKRTQTTLLSVNSITTTNKGGDTFKQPNDNQMEPEVKLSKVKLSKYKHNYVDLQKQVRLVYDFFIKQFDKNPNKYQLSKQRKLKIKARLKDAGEELLLTAITNTAQSNFHRGDNDRGWQADLDFIIRTYEQVERLASLSNEESQVSREELEKYA